MEKVCDHLVIAVCSADKTGTAENPFTASERREMIQQALQGVDIIPRKDVTLIEVPDTTNDADWVKKMLELAGGNVTQVWTGNEWTKRCCEAAGLEVKWIKEVPGISATEIRRKMVAGEPWKNQVPSEVASAVGVIGIDRVKNAK